MALSLAVAFGLWLYVVNTVSQQDDRTYYNVPVVMEGESILNEDNLMITSRSTSTVSVHLSGPRGELNKITSSNSLTVKVDLSKITEPGDDIPLTYTIAYPSNVNTSSLTEESRNPQAIYVDVDYRRTKEIPVQVSWTGNRSEDYIYDTENAVLDNPTITVAGPAAVVDQIDHAQIEVDLSEQVKSISQSYRYTLCDAAGEPVDAQQIVTQRGRGSPGYADSADQGAGSGGGCGVRRRCYRQQYGDHPLSGDPPGVRRRGGAVRTGRQLHGLHHQSGGCGAVLHGADIPHQPAGGCHQPDWCFGADG